MRIGPKFHDESRFDRSMSVNVLGRSLARRVRAKAQAAVDVSAENISVSECRETSFSFEWLSRI